MKVFGKSAPPSKRRKKITVYHSSSSQDFKIAQEAAANHIVHHNQVSQKMPLGKKVREHRHKGKRVALKISKHHSTSSKTKSKAEKSPLPSGANNNKKQIIKTELKNPIKNNQITPSESKNNFVTIPSGANLEDILSQNKSNSETPKQGQYKKSSKIKRTHHSPDKSHKRHRKHRSRTPTQSRSRSTSPDKKKRHASKSKVQKNKVQRHKESSGKKLTLQLDNNENIHSFVTADSLVSPYAVTPIVSTTPFIFPKDDEVTGVGEMEGHVNFTYSPSPVLPSSAGKQPAMPPRAGSLSSDKDGGESDTSNTLLVSHDHDS